MPSSTSFSLDIPGKVKAALIPDSDFDSLSGR